MWDCLKVDKHCSILVRYKEWTENHHTHTVRGSMPCWAAGDKDRTIDKLESDEDDSQPKQKKKERKRTKFKSKQFNTPISQFPSQCQDRFHVSAANLQAI
jgi:hypothetical protein